MQQAFCERHLHAASVARSTDHLAVGTLFCSCQPCLGNEMRTLLPWPTRNYQRLSDLNYSESFSIAQPSSIAGPSLYLDF